MTGSPNWIAAVDVCAPAEHEPRRFKPQEIASCGLRGSYGSLGRVSA
jgi:hypothetical protein